MIIDRDTIVCFDLDDTLYKEVDFLHSGIKFVFSKLLNRILEDDSTFLTPNSNWFEYLQLHAKTTREEILKLYRYHQPFIKLKQEVKTALDLLRSKNISMCLITDGRSITQRNKIKALELDQFFDLIIISEELGSEKPEVKNFKTVVDAFPNKKYVYVGDNISKDFIGPNLLQWTSFCLLDNGLNIHQQNWQGISKAQFPTYKIKELQEILNYL